jgi:SAM-dependent methyltransferase
VTTDGHDLLRSGRLDLAALAHLAARPPRFAPHEAPFWDDPHIARQMLAAHLDPTNDAASRRPETIDRTVAWLVAQLDLRPGQALLDLGCGPGLYCARFARRGLAVTGVDLSAVSLAHARRAARAQGLAIDYVQANYLELDAEAAFDVAVMIYFDFCVLPDADRDALLQRVRRALRPGGAFVFDVTTPRRQAALDGAERWAAREAGFWRPAPHLELTRTFVYPETATDLRQTVILEPDGRTVVYRIWNQAYTPESLATTLAAQGFGLGEVRADLAGTPYDPDGDALGAIAFPR